MSDCPESPAEIVPSLAAERAASIIADLDLAAYCWTLADDRLIWSAAARELFGSARMARVGTGRGYASLIIGGSGLSRMQAVQVAMAPSSSPVEAMASSSVAFETSYCLTTPAELPPGRLWVADRGICHFGPDGRAVRVEGLVRRLSIGRPVRTDIGDGIEPSSERQRLSRLVETQLARSYEEGGEFGFLLLGIDQLGQLNDSYGFHVGDELVNIVWMRLRAQLVDGEQIARFSGAKFGIILPRLGGADPEAQSARAAGRFLAGVNATQPRTSVGALALSASAGAVIAPRHARSLAEVYAHAQDALAAARRGARGRVFIYEPGSDRAAERRANLRFADDIVSALGEGRVSLAFQPVARARDRSIAFYEALVRLQGANGRVYDGATIFPTAERFGLTRLIDRKALELALAALKADTGLRLSVNIAPDTVHDEVWQRMLEAGAGEGLAGRLLIEVTETTVIGDLDIMRERVAWLHRLGCRVAIDDFGVGYTSFRSLRQLDMDVLKIDGSFICSMMASQDDRHFVQALLELAAKLGIETVAEWVLDAATAQQLAAWGCTYLQGEYVGLAAEAAPVTASADVARD